MQYREFIDLTEDEIRFILTEVFAPVKIENIKKNPEWDEITADITTGGWSDGETENFDITDEVTLTVDEIQVDFTVSSEDRLKYKQFLLSKGCHWLLKNNPYIENRKYTLLRADYCYHCGQALDWNDEEQENIKMTPKEAKNILTENLGNIAEHCGAAVGTAVVEALKACGYCIGRRVENYETNGFDCQSGFCPSCGGFADNLHDDCGITVCRDCGQLLDWQLSRCIVTKCIYCERHSGDGAVCRHYADKADEIRRVHTEDSNG